MNGLTLGLYAVFLIAVVLAGNGSALITAVGEDAPRFTIWIIAIALLVALNESKETKPLVAPFAILLALNFILRNFDALREQAATLFKKVTP